MLCPILSRGRLAPVDCHGPKCMWFVEGKGWEHLQGATAGWCGAAAPRFMLDRMWGPMVVPSPAAGSRLPGLASRAREAALRLLESAVARLRAPAPSMEGKPAAPAPPAPPSSPPPSAITLELDLERNLHLLPDGVTAVRGAGAVAATCGDATAGGWLDGPALPASAVEGSSIVAWHCPDADAVQRVAQMLRGQVFRRREFTVRLLLLSEGTAVSVAGHDATAFDVGLHTLLDRSAPEPRLNLQAEPR